MLETFAINSFVVTCSVLIHYEVLSRLSQLIPHLPLRHRVRVLLSIFGALFAHIVEIWLFAFVYFWMIRSGDFGQLVGDDGQSLLGCSYFSFTTYTSLGYGDIEPHGNIRFLAGIEALTGLVLISWTASFVFLEMQRFWNRP